MSVETNTLESMCELIVDCPHSTPEWTDKGYLVTRNQNIKNGVLDLGSPSFTNRTDYLKRIKRAKPAAGDIIFTREAPMGEVCMIPDGLECCLGQRQVLLRPKFDICGEYLFWALQSPYVQNQISWNQGTGSTVSNVRIPVLKALSIPRHQNKESGIAKILSDVSRKIELNRQTNQTLEQIAQAIFKSWFVDFEPTLAKIAAKKHWQALHEVTETSSPTCYSEEFDSAKPSDQSLEEAMSQAAMAAISGESLEELEQLSQEQQQHLREVAALFPDSLVDSELGEKNSSGTNLDAGIGGPKGGGMDSRRIPPGWEMKSIRNVGKVITGKTPPKNIENAYSSSGIPFITPTDVDNNIFVTKTNRSLSNEGQLAIRNTKIKGGSICVTCIGSQMGKTTIAPQDSFTNQQINSITPNEIYFRNFLLLNLRNRREEIFLIGSSGSTMPIINKSNFEKLNLVLPSTSILVQFDYIITPLINKILELENQIFTLSNLRDSLLPKLLSGELTIDEVAQ